MQDKEMEGSKKARKGKREEEKHRAMESSGDYSNSKDTNESHLLTHCLAFTYTGPGVLQLNSSYSHSG